MSLQTSEVTEVECKSESSVGGCGISIILTSSRALGDPRSLNTELSFRKRLNLEHVLVKNNMLNMKSNYFVFQFLFCSLNIK